MRQRTIAFTLSSLLIVTLVAAAFTRAQEPTPDPIGLTATAIVGGATLTAAFGPSNTPSVGTPTPLAGLCNSLTFRSLDDVAGALDGTLASALAEADDMILRSVEVTALEDTEDCITFAVRETDVTITIATLVANDEAALGDALAILLATLPENETLDDLPDVTLMVAFTQGNQTRTLQVDYRDAIRLLEGDPDLTGAALFDALAWLD